MTRYLVRAVLPVLLALAASAEGRTPAPQPGAAIMGRVTAAESGTPLAGANVSIQGTTRRTVTNARGDYRISVPAGEHTVQVSYLGRDGGTRRVRVADGQTLRADFALAQRALELDAITVNAVTGKVERSTVGANTSTITIRGVDAASAGVAASTSPRTPPADGAHPHPRPDFNTEEYAHIQENPFLSPATAPLSTFSIDVDAASYSNVRRILRDGELPPKDAVRIEELVNYFSYDYAEPRGREPFTVVTEVGDAPWNPQHRLVHIGLQGRSVDAERMPASNLVFLIDVSGSMQSHDKLPLVKSSLRLLVDQLRPRDRVAIVVYAGAAGLVLPSTPGDRKDAIMDAIEGLEAGGSTAGGAGLRLAYATARESLLRGGNNRVILATDGDFNVGVSSEGELVRLVEDERRDGIFLTVLGFGTGNLADARMEALADKGNGNYAYVDDLLEARKVLVSEMGGTLLTIARDVKLQVEFNPARVRAYRLIGYENRLLAAEDFNDDRKDAGELGAGHSVTALYEVVPVGADSDVQPRGVDALRYQTPAASSGAHGGELLNVKLRYKEPDGETSRLLARAVRDPGRGARTSNDFRFAAAVAEWGMLLRESEHRGRSTADGVLALARGARGEDREGYRAEFIRLVEGYVPLAAARRESDLAGR
jgi:Ca-activated chloride channel family protein